MVSYYQNKVIFKRNTHFVVCEGAQFGVCSVCVYAEHLHWSYHCDPEIIPEVIYTVAIIIIRNKYQPKIFCYNAVDLIVCKYFHDGNNNCFFFQCSSDRC